MRYRCHVGHGFNSESLRDGMDEKLEDTLWSALRAIEENIELRSRMKVRATDQRLTAFSATLDQEIADMKQRAAALRRLLLGPREHATTRVAATRASDSRMAKKPARRRKQRPAAPLPLPVAHAPAPDFTIVGVGASAGGFEAFAQLLEGLPANPNIAIIFVQHLAPHHSSSLASLLVRPYAAAGGRSDRRRAHRGQSRLRRAAQCADGAGGRSPAPRPAPRGSQSVQPHRFLLSIARALAARTCDRRRAVGHRVGRRARHSRDQDDGGHHVRAGSRHGQIRRHAARRDCHANGRRRRLARPRSRPR